VSEPATLLDLYERMLLIRRFEEEVERLFTRGRIHGTTHLCIGQEATAVGVCAALHAEDWVSGNHRSHGHALARGLCPKRLMAELMGKQEGFCGGRGGTQHFAWMPQGFLGSNGITGGGVGIATGAALALKMQGKPGVVVSFFGDGAMSQGSVHEAMNMGALWGLPVLYVCENNLYGMSTPVGRAVCSPTLGARAEAYCIPARSVDGNDVTAVLDAASEALASIRESGGPRFLECMTYRFCGHSKNDPRAYRSREEEAQWTERDPLILAQGGPPGTAGVTEHELASVGDRVDREVAGAVEYAEACEWPSPDELVTQ